MLFGGRRRWILSPTVAGGPILPRTPSSSRGRPGTSLAWNRRVRGPPPCSCRFPMQPCLRSLCCWRPKGRPPPGCVAFHISGALGTDPLAPLLERGYAVGTIHPLQALADPVLGGEQLEGYLFLPSRENRPPSRGPEDRGPSGLSPITVPVARRPLYHAAAVFASNYLAGLIGAAGRLMAQAGVPEEEALQAILPLARGSLENLGRLGSARALTGPISRGDIETVRLHLRTLEPRERNLYAALGLEILQLAVEGEGGPDDNVAEELRELLEKEK